DAGAIHKAAQHVAPQRIRATQELGIGGLQTDGETALVEIELIGIVWGQYWRQDGDHHKPTQDQRTHRPEWLAAAKDGEGPPYALGGLEGQAWPSLQGVTWYTPRPLNCSGFWDQARHNSSPPADSSQQSPWQKRAPRPGSRCNPAVAPHPASGSPPPAGGR